LIAIWMMQAPGARNETRTLLRSLVYGALVDPPLDPAKPITAIAL
jgi:hypothetical protein